MTKQVRIHVIHRRPLDTERLARALIELARQLERERETSKPASEQREEIRRG